jgi:hypothetical protein
MRFTSTIVRGGLVAALPILSGLTLFSVGARAQGSSGATLQAAKTIDICDNGGGTWHYSGVVAVWNNGAAQACGLQIQDTVQYKLSGPVWSTIMSSSLNTAGYGTCGTFPAGTGQVPGYTDEIAAEIFSYGFDAATAPFGSTIRNDAQVTIMNHSGPGFKTISGPDPKATYAGSIPPPACAQVTSVGCTLTQGYWGVTGPAEAPHTWPSGYDPAASFYLSGTTWFGVLQIAPQGSGYYILADQYIAATLNVASGAAMPSGVKTIYDQATAWLTANTPSACSVAGSCGDQKNWGAILDTYNNGLYPGGPTHCGSN